MKRTTVLNGFGRFGLHFLHYYLERSQNSQFLLTEINDEALSLENMLTILSTDNHVRILDTWNIRVNGNRVTFDKNGIEREISFHNTTFENFLTNSHGDILECSGKYTETDLFPAIDKTRKVFISATSLSADATIIMGVNEEQLKTEHQFISYGSCTVNAFVPLADRLNLYFNILSADVNVIHNIPFYKLIQNPEVFERRSCTLSYMGPKLLEFLNPDNFNVNYTIVPITGVSRIDFRFELRKEFEVIDVFNCIQAISTKSDVIIYKIWDEDNGPQNSLLSNYSSEFILDQCAKVGQNIYLSAYFDTENSVNRYFDLVNYYYELKYVQ